MIKLITISILLELYLCIGSPKRIARGHVIDVAIAPIPEKHKSTEQIEPLLEFLFPLYFI